MKVSTFSDRLQEMMKARHMTAIELTRRTGVPGSSFQRYVQGKSSPTLDNVEKIANALDVSVPWLIGEDAPKDPGYRYDELSHLKAKFFDDNQDLMDAIQNLSKKQKQVLIKFADLIYYEL